MIVFVSGGTRSGKSEVAEQHVIKAASGGNCYYIATAEVYDTEMAARVARHQRARDARWITIEAPVAIDQAIASVPNGAAVLLDCLTLWASQTRYASGLTDSQGKALLVKSVQDARSRGIHLVLVSNDLNEDLLPRNQEVWQYLTFLQSLHCWLTVEADSVLEVVAGHTIEWKPKDGSL
ncbi:bifunctional adenosylcobinamide kinase/adenosylcobinamide-phosphate guanylyltransferase [Vreelandella populi]|uniref:Bifunctional adenosylcobalamin biosynthesis protein n=1 Tax=Vreelandella populi TaxID=2498858 RepID=A0A3S0YQ15_9GAMM|nr:bifunctional adenosylcobinamide kinase/adenosylcobinamide-phosphate guanylyltransferase [Halomonas populi]RUR40876.1 bifunctional adenosylcobinamide kinase/adenosylcobinamide-phosphate guanylyltransferase [Halomonas populi]RUR49384.1 bifunctional adenosylcobinamide kinase/adenosylcobinamide-phosphate guanylyltransferase [Halomonas populi]RUR55868.1 bifunctional adenosylcobinamide kinase/adenosylcobinamide-phosphate guanylyltransferase [Halomonas populi]